MFSNKVDPCYHESLFAFKESKARPKAALETALRLCISLNEQNSDGENKETKHTVLNTSDQASFRLIPEVIVQGDVPKADIDMYQDQTNRRFSNTIHRIDYRFDEANTNWNALIKPDIAGQLRFFGYDPVTGIGGILRDQDGDGKPDGATLFLKDNEYGDLNPDPFIIEDPIGSAELQEKPKLVATEDGLGLTVEGPEGLGLWVRLKTNRADGDWQNSLQLISDQRDQIGGIGATATTPTLDRRRFISKWVKNCDSSNRPTIVQFRPHRPSNLNATNQTKNGHSAWGWGQFQSSERRSL